MKRNIFIILIMLVPVMMTGVVNAQNDAANAADKDTVSIRQDAEKDTVSIGNDGDVSIDTSTGTDTALVRDDSDTAVDTTADTTVNISTSNDTASVPRDNAASIDTSITNDRKQLPPNINPPANPNAKPDSIPKLSGTFFGLGFGLSIGNIPLFTMWQNALPTTLKHLDLPNTFIDQLNNDTLPLRYSVVESPEQFNFVLPFSVSIYNVRENSVTAFSLSYFQNSKQFQSTIASGHDSLGQRVNVHEILRYYSFTIEASYHAAIPPAFFSIDNAQQSFFSLGIGVSPLNYFSREGAASASKANSPMQAVADSAAAKLTGLSANGMAVTWRLGINTLKGYANGGIEMGLFYSGSYSAYFYSNGEEVTKHQIHPVDGEVDKPLSFLSNRVEFKVSFIRPTKRGDKENAK